MNLGTVNRRRFFLDVFFGWGVGFMGIQFAWAEFIWTGWRSTEILAVKRVDGNTVILCRSRNLRYIDSAKINDFDAFV